MTRSILITEQCDSCPKTVRGKSHVAVNKLMTAGGWKSLPDGKSKCDKCIAYQAKRRGGS